MPYRCTYTHLTCAATQGGEEDTPATKTLSRGTDEAATVATPPTMQARGRWPVDCVCPCVEKIERLGLIDFVEGSTRRVWAARHLFGPLLVVLLVVPR